MVGTRNMNKALTIFVDSDAFVAITKKDDSNHERAKDIFLKLQDKPVAFVTSNYVFSEVATVLSQKVDHETAVAYIHTMKSQDCVFIVERITENTEEAATQIFIKQTSKNVSFVDCTNIALIREKHIDGIFSFDDDYKKNGIELIENLL